LSSRFKIFQRIILTIMYSESQRKSDMSFRFKVLPNGPCGAAHSMRPDCFHDNMKQKCNA